MGNTRTKSAALSDLSQEQSKHACKGKERGVSSLCLFLSVFVFVEISRVTGQALPKSAGPPTEPLYELKLQQGESVCQSEYIEYDMMMIWWCNYALQPSGHNPCLDSWILLGSVVTLAAAGWPADVIFLTSHQTLKSREQSRCNIRRAADLCDLSQCSRQI